jgi:Leucine-rich repeat (LRR) protein
MKSVFQKCLIALLAILWGVSSVQAQSVNMSRYITMTVKKGKVIQLDFHGDEENTLVRIVSGTIDTTINVKSVALPKGFKTDADTMTVYGNIFDFSCAFNYGNVYGLNTDHNTQLKFLAFDNDSLTTIDVSKNTQLVELGCSQNYLTSLDVSHNTKLTFLNCFGNKLTSLDINHNKELNKLYYFNNPFTTATLDDIYCSLPDRKGKTPGIIRPYSGDSSKNKDIVLATNGSNATSKNWKIQDHASWKEMTGFTGTHQCGGGSGVNMERYITFTVRKGAKIEIDFAADEENTPVKIVSGTTDQTITVGVDWVGSMDYVAGDATMTVYGNVRRVDCNENKGNITALDASHNVPLAYINCDNNSISSLNVSKNTQLSALYCSDNSLATLDVSNNGQLEYLNCYNNKLTQLDLKNNTKLTFLNCGRNTISSLDLSKNTQLSILYCNDNKLTSLSIDRNILLKSFGCNNNMLSVLDVSKNTQLDILYCYTNRLTKLDVSKNTQLKRLYCHTNNFTTAALDDIYCSLPDRKGQTEGQIQPLFNASSADKSKVLATNGNNAIAKGWKIQYFEKNTDITGFTGTHQCGGGTGIDEAKGLPALAVYPNPVKDVLNIATDKPVHSIRIYNVYGTEVAHATDTNSVNVSHLPAGVYMVRADGKVARIIKE